MATEPPTTATAVPPTSATIWSRPFLLTWLSTWLIFLGFYFLLPTLPGYMLEIGGTTAQVGWLIGLLTFSAVVSRPLGGRLADKRGKPYAMWIGAILLTGSMLLYFVARTPSTLLALRCFHGIGWAIYLTAGVALIADLAHPTQRATVTGHYFLANTMAMILGPWLAIFILKHTSYFVLFSAATISTALALVTTALLRREVAVPAGNIES